MTVLRKIWIWFLMLSKRLYKKPSFLFILILIPVIMLAYGKAAQQDSGVITIALTAQDTNDIMANQIIEELVGSSPLIRYISVKSAEEAKEMVQMQRADAAWIFPEDMQAKVMQYITAERGRKPIVQVVVRQKDITVMLSGEKLSGVLFRYCARDYYLDYLRHNVEALSAYTDEELLAFYDTALITDQLFSFTNTEGNALSQAQSNYLLTPMRGLLGIIIVLCGLATAMYYEKDNRSGMFAYLPFKKKAFAEMGYQGVSLLNIGAVVYVCLVVLGLSAHAGKELVLMLLYVLCTMSFSMLVRVCCGSLRGLGTAMVLIVVVMMAVCPVFYDFAVLRDFQLLLPPTYFVNAVFNDSYICYMLIYIAVCFFITESLRRIFKRF